MRKFLENCKASAIGFIVSMVVVAILVSSLVTTVALNIENAQDNASVATIPGGDAMLGIIGLLFIVIPVIIFAKAAK